MNFTTIAWKGMRQRALSSLLTAFSVALGVMLMVTILVIFGIVDRMFRQSSVGYNLIVGPKGSELQLVLSTIFRIERPIQNVPFRYYEQLKNDPRIKAAIPITLGDFTERGGFPICGTTSEFFDTPYGFSPRDGQPMVFLMRGHPMSHDFDAVIGSHVAMKNGWDVGTKLKLVHASADSGHVHDEEFTVVAVIAPTGTPNDKTVFVNIDGFYQIEGHEKPWEESIQRERDFFNEPSLSKEEMNALVASYRKKYGDDEHHDSHGTDHHHHHQIPSVRKEVTSILVLTKTDSLAPILAGEINSGYSALAVNPIFTIRRLNDMFLANIHLILLVLTGLIIVVSGVSIFVSIYNSMSARRREIAILRALGATRATIFSIIIAESLILCVGGGLLGMAMGHGMVFAAAPIVQARVGLLINPLSFEVLEFALIPCLFLLGIAVGFLPAHTAYRFDVATGLQS